MKRKWIPVVLVISAFFLFACSLTGLFTGDNKSATDVPDNQVVTNPTEEPDEQQPAPINEGKLNDVCNHPLFPIVEGATWTYQYETDEGYTMTIDEVDENRFTMTQVMDDENTVLTNEWYCSEDGILQGNFGQVNFLDESTELGDFELAFETIEWNGETLPPMDALEVGYTWNSDYTLTADVDMQGFNTTMEMTISIEHTLGAIEEVMVQAGTFPNAYRIDSVSSVTMNLGLGEAATPYTVQDFSYSSWYAKGVGMVKSDDEFAGYESMVELVSSSFLD